MKKLPFVSLLLLIIVLASSLLISPRVNAAPITCPDGTQKDKDGNQTIEEVCGSSPAASASPACQPKTSFLGLPTWYAYLPGKTTTDSSGNAQCIPQLKCVVGPDSPNCDSQSSIDISKLWLIALAVLELLFRLVGVIAVFMVVFGGIKYVISQGQPDATKGARQTIINACIGIAISIIAAASVNFGAKLLQ